MRLNPTDRFLQVLLRLFKILAYLVSTLLILVAAAGVLSQTSFIRDMIRSYIVSTIAKNINGSLQIGKIEGNLISGFTMDTITIVQGDREVVSIGRIVCLYEPFGLLRNTVDVSRLVIESPTVTLVKSDSGTWNLASLLRGRDDTAAGDTGWTVQIADLQVRGGSLVVEDSAAASRADPGLPVSFSSSPRFAIEGIWCEGSLAIRGSRSTFEIDGMKWYSSDPALEVLKLSARIEVEPERTSIAGLTLRTAKSTLELDGSIGRSLLAGFPPAADMKDDPVGISLDAASVDYRELRLFLTTVPAGEGSASIICEAGGTLGDVSVSRLSVASSRSDITLRGKVANLHDPPRVYLDVQIAPSRFSMRELSLFVRQIPPELAAVEQPVSIEGRFTGPPDDFTTDLDLGGHFGRLRGRGAMHLNVSPPSYSGSYDMEDFNPGRLVGDDLPGTAFNGRIELQGEGFDPERMRTNFFVILSGSRVQGYSIDALQANGTVNNGTIDAEAHAQSGPMDTDGAFTARISGDTISLDAADLSVDSLDLAEILQDTSYRSTISARGRASFSGSSADNLNAGAELVLLPSMFRGHAMQTDTISLRIDQNNPLHRIVRLRSAMADIELDGQFDLRRLPEIAVERFGRLAEVLRRHIDEADSVRRAAASARVEKVRPTASPSSPVRRTETAAPSAASDRMNFTYRATLTDILPVAEFITTTPFNIRGTLEGSFANDPQGLSAAVRGRLEEFYIGTVEDGVLFRDASVSATVTGLGDTAAFERLDAEAELAVRTGIIGGTKLDGVLAGLRYSGSTGRFHAAGIIDSTVAVGLRGQASIQPAAYVFDLDTLQARAGGYGWLNDQDVQFRLSAEGLRIMRAVFRRGDEEIAARGLLGKRGAMEADVTIRRFDLSALNVLLPSPELKGPGNGFAGAVNAEIKMGGTPDAPLFTVNASSGNFVLRKTRLGRLEVSLGYAEKVLTVKIENRPAKSTGEPALTVEGRMPANFSFAGGDVQRFPDLEQDIRIHARDFDIGVLDPLIAELQNLGGRLNSNLVIAGTPDSPVYTGSMALSDVRCVFVPNNLPYIVNGTIEASGSRLELKNFTVENLPTARPSGKMDLGGTIVTDRFRLESFDITGSGSLLVLGEESRRALPEMYGPLFIRSDDINLKGTPARPFLSGNVLVTDAFITFPPKDRQQTTLGFRRLNYVVVNDTAPGYVPEEDFLKPFFGDEQPAPRDTSGEPKEAITLPFIEALRYSLNVETRGTPSIRIIFSQLSDEVLYAELDGKVSVINDAGEPRIYGSIRIMPPSYYKFYQRFDASGLLKFLGPWDNPELDVKATYEATHTRADDEDAAPRRIQVLLEITGRRYEPILKMTLREESSGGNFVNLSGTSTPGETQSDAITFILTGKLANELTASDRSSIAGDVSPGTGAMVGSILTSSLLTGALEDYIRREFPFIRSVDVTYEGGSAPGTNVQVSANALRGYLRVGGKILSDVGRASVSYKASLGDVFNSNSIRNLFFQIEQRLESETAKNKNTVEGRVYYRFSF